MYNLTAENILSIAGNVLAIIISGLISTAFLTLLERKVIASIQRRTGPKIAGFYGILQPFSDGLKLVFKECVIPYRANRVVFILAPITIFFLSILNLSFLPINFYAGPLIRSDFGLLYIIIISSLQTFGFIISAWCSQSSYSLLASLRISAAIISYEAVLLSCIIILALYTRSLNIEMIIFLQ